MPEIMLTDDQRTEMVQQRRLQMALKHLPDAVWYTRAIATAGQPERGDVLSEWSAPMRITAADDADEVYASLVKWVAYFAWRLDRATPSSTAVAWSAGDDFHGFKAGTTPEGAHMLTKLQTMWLAIHADEFLRDVKADMFRTMILDLEIKLRARYPRAPRKGRRKLRACPDCGAVAVGAVWFSVDPMDVRIACEVCKYEVPDGELQDWMLPDMVGYDDD